MSFKSGFKNRERIAV